MTTLEIRDIETRLSLWRNKRNIKIEEQKNGLIGNLLEELTEYERSNDIYGKIDSLSDMVTFLINSVGTANKYIQNTLFAECSDPLDIVYITREIISDMSVEWKLNILFEQMRLLGYNPYKCMLETIKEISSRKQDPKQKADWEKGIFKDTDKWLKWKEQPSDTLYKADYSKCRL